MASDDNHRGVEDGGEMSDDSMHSLQSVNSVNSTVSSNTSRSLQDIELAETLHGSNKDFRKKARKKKTDVETSEFEVLKIMFMEKFKVEFKKAKKQLTSKSFRKMNTAVLSILITEAAERFAYYGFRASLVLYFTQELKMNDATAISLFAFASYVANFTPIFGAVLGDSFVGRFRTIVCFGVVYWVGLVVLTRAAYLNNFTVHELRIKRAVTLIGLALICTGTGGIKPCVSIFGADQVNIREGPAKEQKSQGENTATNVPSNVSASTRTSNSEEKQEKVRAFFSFFSICINLGAVLSFLVIPTVKGHYGFGAAFMLPTCFMLLALVVFVSQRNKYKYRPHNPHGSSLLTTFRLCLWLLHNNLWSNPIISDNFPALEPGPVPLPTNVPIKTDTTVVEGISVHVANTMRSNEQHEGDDNTSVSSMSASMRSLSRDIRRRLSRSSSRDESSRQSESPREEGNVVSPGGSSTEKSLGMDLPSRSPSLSSSPRRAMRSPAHDAEAGAGSTTQSVSGASLQTSDRYLAQQLSDAARALNVLPVLAMLPMFWLLYDQQGSVWTLQASRMNLHGIMQPEQINVLNPVGLFVLIPVFDKVVYPTLEKQKYDISPLRRIGWGMILVSLAFFISGIVEYVIDYRIQNELRHISVFWQIPQICLMTVAEIFISVTGLEFAYSVSPDRLKSFVMAAYLMTIAKGDFWGGVLYSTVFHGMNQAIVLHIFAFAMMGNLACYGYVVRSWELRHGIISFDLFDKVLETEETRQRSSLICRSLSSETEAKGMDDDVTPLKQERGRARWRRRGRKSKSDKIEKTPKKELKEAS